MYLQEPWIMGSVVSAVTAQYQSVHLLDYIYIYGKDIFSLSCNLGLIPKAKFIIRLKSTSFVHRCLWRLLVLHCSEDLRIVDWTEETDDVLPKSSEDFSFCCDHLKPKGVIRLCSRDITYLNLPIDHSQITWLVARSHDCWHHTTHCYWAPIINTSLGWSYGV